MYVGAGATLEGKLGEAITSANVDVQTVSVSTGNVITVKTSQQLDGVSARAIVDATAGFVDEVIIKNTDSVTHSVTIQINDGANTRELITTLLAQGSTLTYKPSLGWQTTGPYIGSGWITSGMLGNASVLSGSIGSGQIGGPHIASGGISSGKIGNAAVVSGSIASGQVFDNHFSSGARIDSAEYLVADGLISAEVISGALPGARAVAINTSGALVVAMAGQSGRFPAVGVCIDNVDSGQPVRRYHKGRLFSQSFNFSGNTATFGAPMPIWLGVSGELTINNVAVSTLPLGSGINQIMGYRVSQSGMTIEMNYVASGTVGRFAIASGAILSGHISSGQIGPFHIGSGAIQGSQLASGAVTQFKIGSGALVSYARQSVADLYFSGTVSEEAISGVRAINISQSGYARIAMAGVSGRMPAVGVLVGNVASGVPLAALSGNALITRGRVQVTSGRIPTSGFGLYLYVGMSGDLIRNVGITSGMVIQRIGVIAGSGGMIVAVGDRITSGLETTFKGNF
jgi:hypothetical protein